MLVIETLYIDKLYQQNGILAKERLRKYIIIMARIVINYFSSVTVLYFVVELTIHNFNISIESINSSLITYIRQKLSIT